MTDEERETGIIDSTIYSHGTTDGLESFDGLANSFAELTRTSRTIILNYSNRKKLVIRESKGRHRVYNNKNSRVIGSFLINNDERVKIENFLKSVKLAHSATVIGLDEFPVFDGERIYYDEDLRQRSILPERNHDRFIPAFSEDTNIFTLIANSGYASHFEGRVFGFVRDGRMFIPEGYVLDDFRAGGSIPLIVIHENTIQRTYSSFGHDRINADYNTFTYKDDHVSQKHVEDFRYTIQDYFSGHDTSLQFAAYCFFKKNPNLSDNIDLETLAKRIVNGIPDETEERLQYFQNVLADADIETNISLKHDRKDDLSNKLTVFYSSSNTENFHSKVAETIKTHRKLRSYVAIDFSHLNISDEDISKIIQWIETDYDKPNYNVETYSIS